MKVSILMTAYNAEKYIHKSIKSVLNQTYKDFEFIIINDGSTDKTLDIINEFERKDERIKVISHNNCGMGKSLNIGLKIASSELIFRIDADDIMLPNRIEVQTKYMLENSDIAVTGCLAYYINENDNKIGKTYSYLKKKEDCMYYKSRNEPIGLLHPGVVFRKDIVLEAGGYRDKFWPAEDIDLWNRLIDRGYYIITLQEILMLYRIHNGSVITSKFIDSRRKFEWVRGCMRARRQNIVEPTWDDYLQSFKDKSIYKKINWYRKTYAKSYYRSAGFEYAQKRLLSFSAKLILAFILQPVYVSKKIIKQNLIK